MAEPSSLLDPFGLWRGLAAKLEQGAKELADKGVNSDEFARGMHKVMSAALSARKLNRAAARRFLAALEVPTRADVEALAERLHTIDDRLIEIAAALDRLGAKPSRSAVLPSPPRTRKPPADAAPALAAAPPATVPQVAAAARKKPASAPKSKGTR